MARGNLAVWVISVGVVFLGVTPAFAYLGPGAGLTAIGAFLALILGMIFAFLGFIWYPVRRLLRKGKAATGDASQQQKKTQPQSANESE
jgi:hypothetical protein